MVDIVRFICIISSMTGDNELKINLLRKNAPNGVVLTTAWLKKQGISNKLAWWYVKSGWFEHISDGAYCFSGNPISWAGAISSIQQQLKLPIYPGGKTALQLLGKGHYVGMGLHSIQLFAVPKTKIPRWLKAPYWNESFAIYRPALFKSENESWLTTFEVSGQSIILSTPEKASIELCYLVPNIITFAEAVMIIEGLPRMRPKLLQGLLEACQSYKAKRLLLYLAEHFQHQWFKDLDFTQIDLGKGKRVIAGGGHYNSKYKISVPSLGENE